MGLKFDADAAYRALADRYYTEIHRLTEMVLATAKATAVWQSVRDGLYMLVSVLAIGEMEGIVTADTWELLIEEWGKGSLMDTSNPALEAYRDSALWNPLRHDLAIRGRPAGTYVGLDGKQHVSSGQAAGRDLENLYGRGHIHDPSYAPSVPHHTLRNALESNRTTIMNQLHGVLETFDWSPFFIETPG